MYPIAQFLSSLQVDVFFDGKNALWCNGKKVSGNAQCFSSGKIMHHGTLLFDTDLSVMKVVLKGHEGIFHRSVLSRKVEVTNISNFCTQKNVRTFVSALADYFIRYYKITTKWEPTTLELEKIEQISNTKYSSWSWNYAHSPQCFVESLYQGERIVFSVVDGTIQFNTHTSHTSSCLSFLQGVSFMPDAIIEACKKEQWEGEEIEKLIKSFFTVS